MVRLLEGNGVKIEETGSGKSQSQSLSERDLSERRINGLTSAILTLTARKSLFHVVHSLSPVDSVLTPIC